MNNLQEGTPDAKQHNSLQRGLTEYGLSPEDWLLTQEDDLLYRIAHLREPEFFFRGTVQLQDGERKWKSITLAGL